MAAAWGSAVKCAPVEGIRWTRLRGIRVAEDGEGRRDGVEARSEPKRWARACLRAPSMAAAGFGVEGKNEREKELGEADGFRAKGAWHRSRLMDGMASRCGGWARHSAGHGAARAGGERRVGVSERGGRR